MDEAAKNKLKRFLVNRALCKEESSFRSRIIFRKVKQLYGENVSVIVSASAPLSRDALHFLRIAMDIPIYEIFGQTESSDVCSRNQTDRCAWNEL
ncbi:unnamed protein product [Rotaria sordida]|uniref:Uncharacterized protein n=1 Tax=Rotaria sordida TaxID=392033 RepID=A0A813YV07_9BILA|nr:unnamed protein product [Rotaria sordida]CAF0889468.1 unnamed protein product [Rotaria sordida]CAF3803976.1 unnamed protein product [Rotaria sordida]CAF3830465.1 unnamed protein product [Rotaria sordida]